MSHGAQNTMSLAGKDQLHIYKDVVQYFGNGEFAEFAENPKIFIFQGCQSFDSPISVPTDTKLNTTQTYENIQLIFPCGPGYQAVRDCDEGTWFTQTFAKLLQAKETSSMHLAAIIDKVNWHP